MANEDHLAKLAEGVAAWNAWRKANPDITPDLTDADLRHRTLAHIDFKRADLSGADLECARLGGANLFEAGLTHANLPDTDLERAYLEKATLVSANLSRARLKGASLQRAILREAVMVEADLRQANLSEAELHGAGLTRADLGTTDLHGARLEGAHLAEANLDRADLTGADLRGAHLERSMLLETNLTDANLAGARIYGISAWNLNLDRTTMHDLVITPEGDQSITVDSIEIAQFLYLLMTNHKIRNVIEYVGDKAVLLLGRFTEGRKEVLETIRTRLRDFGYVPIVFDFERPANLDLTETISTLAGLCKFIISDITKPRSNPLELQAIVPDFMVPIVPLLQEGEEPFAMFAALKNKYRWLLDIRTYRSSADLNDSLHQDIITPAEAMAKRLRKEKARELIQIPIGGEVCCGPPPSPLEGLAV